VPVHWVIHFDARGEHNLRYRCKNVNLVEKTVKGVEDEQEYLFVPYVVSRTRSRTQPYMPLFTLWFRLLSYSYSVFTVISVHVPPKITGSKQLLQT
jgi:hypothetical protein